MSQPVTENAAQSKGERPARGVVWTGRVISGLMVAALAMSAVMKFIGGPEFAEGSAHLGLPPEMRVPLGVLEIVCVLIYAIPQTAVLGAILLTGYMGGAILAHVRVGDAIVPQIIIGVLVWLGIFLRDRRLWQLLPWRRIS